MPSVVFLVPGPIETPTGGYVYDRRIIEGLRHLGWAVELRRLDDSFPHPTPAALDHAAGELARVRNGGVVLVDGLAYGAMPDLAEQESSRLRLAALVHLPLAADIGLDRYESARVAVDERRSLAAASLVIVTGTATLPMLEKYALPAGRKVVVEPGTDRVPLARGSGGDDVHMLCVATLHPGKGHETLFRALAALPHRHWHLTCAGSVVRDPATAARLETLLRDLQLDAHVTMVGELDSASLAEWYDRSDVFVLATLQETYGMAVAEALARGLPVVATTTGASPSLVGDAAGLLVPPGDVDALSGALGRVIDDRALRARLSAGARCVRERLPTWEQAAATMAAALERVTT